MTYDSPTPPKPRRGGFITKMPLPAYFAAFGLLSGVLFGAAQYLTGSELWWAGGIFFGLGMGAFFTWLESKQRERGDLSERARYLAAVASGKPSGDVTAWPEFIRADKKMNTIVGLIGTPFLLMLGISGLILGPTWTAAILLPLAALGAFNYFRQRRLLRALDETLSPAA